MSLRALQHAAAGIALLAPCVTACGSTDSSTDSPGGGNGALAGDSSTAAAGQNSGGNSLPNAGTSGAGGQLTTGGVGNGYIVLAHQAASAGLVELRTAFDQGQAVTCPSIATYGNCNLTLCPTTDATTPALSLSAGAVSATSTPVAMQVVATPDAQAAGGYQPVQQTLTGDLKGGETITLAAAGADVPAFSHDLKMLAPLVLTKPTSTNTTIPIARSGVDLQWQPGEAGSNVNVVAFGSGSGWTSMICSWDASSGAGNVPPDALKPLPNGQELFITARRDAVQNVGNFVIQLSLLTSAQVANDTRPRALVLTDSL